MKKIKSYRTLRELIQEEAKNDYPALINTYKIQLASAGADSKKHSELSKSKVKYSEYPED